MQAARWRLRRQGRRGVSQIIATILLVLITVVLMTLIYLVKFPITAPPPSLTYASSNDVKYPVWGDPTDCYPTLPHDWEYYLGWDVNGSVENASNEKLYDEYMGNERVPADGGWWGDCEYGDNGTYNLMDAAVLTITGISGSIPLSGIQFQFICTNTTPKYEQTYLVNGAVEDMEWVPGSSQNVSTSAPTLGTCATYNPQGSGANSVYYNRLGFFNPLNLNTTSLTPGMSVVIYVHTPGSVLEAPNPLTDVSEWGANDTDDYHGAPLWCFTVPGSCTLRLVDTNWNPAIVLLSVPVYLL